MFCVSLGILSGVTPPQDFFSFSVSLARPWRSHACSLWLSCPVTPSLPPGLRPLAGRTPTRPLASPARPCPWPLALPHAQDRKPPTHMHTKNAVHLAWSSCTLAHSPLSMGHGRPWPLGSSLMSHPPLCALVLPALRRVGRRASVTDRPFAAAPCPRSPVPRKPSRAASPPPPSRRPPTPPPEWPG